MKSFYALYSLTNTVHQRRPKRRPEILNARAQFLNCNEILLCIIQLDQLSLRDRALTNPTQRHYILSGVSFRAGFVHAGEDFSSTQ